MNRQIKKEKMLAQRRAMPKVVAASSGTEMVQFGKNEAVENDDDDQGVLMQGNLEVWDNNNNDENSL